MATLKLNKNKTAGPDGKPTEKSRRAPLRGQGVNKPRPTLAQAQADRAQREAEYQQRRAEEGRNERHHGQRDARGPQGRDDRRSGPSHRDDRGPRREGGGFGDRREGGGFGERRDGGFGDRGGNRYGEQRREGGFGDQRREGYGQRREGGYGDRPDRGPRDDRGGFGRPDREGGERRPFNDRPRFEDRPRQEGDRPRRDDRFGGQGPRGDRPYGDRPYGDRPQGDRPFGDRPPRDRAYGDRPQGDRPRHEGGRYGNDGPRRDEGSRYGSGGGFGGGSRYGDDRPRRGPDEVHARAEREERAERTDRPRRPEGPRQPAPERLADADAGERLSKRMSELGLASRREADEWIEAGWVTVDGQPATLGQRVGPDAKIEVDPAAREQQAQRVTILLHKPIGYVSGQAEDGYEPAAVLVKPESHWGEDPAKIQWAPGHGRNLAPAGRLDIDSTGLLVLTQDGRIARHLIGEDSDVEKEYLVRVAVENGDPDQHPQHQLDPRAIALLNHGLELDGVELKPAKVSWANEDQLRFVLREGKKRQIRRMCELVGLKVVGLKRVRIGRVSLGDLPLGQWRYLAPWERF
ncbi:RNA pseudouridylate synthase domain-containing protein [Ditylenchus destructor]|nr:RNA pseudouridylate synthase domain-containing protein [Ditylenchus destructor]